MRTLYIVEVCDVGRLELPRGVPPNQARALGLYFLVLFIAEDYPTQH